MIEKRGGIDDPVSANAFGSRNKIGHLSFWNFERTGYDPSEHMAVFRQFDLLTAGKPGFNLRKIIAQITYGSRLHCDTF